MLLVTVACATPKVSETPLANTGTSASTTEPSAARTRAAPREAPIALDVHDYRCTKGERRTEKTALLVDVQGTSKYVLDALGCALAADGGVAVVASGSISIHIALAVAVKRGCAIKVAVYEGQQPLFGHEETRTLDEHAPDDAPWKCIDDLAALVVERVLQQLPMGLTLSPWP